MRRASLTLAVGLALALSPTASSHVLAEPQLVARGTTSTVQLIAINDRDSVMTEFSVTVPGGFAIARAEPVDGWSNTLEGATATWSGGRIAPRARLTFTIELEASAAPGPAAFQAAQGYPGGEVAPWPVTMFVVPGSEKSSGGFGLVLVIVLLGLALTAGAGVLVRRRAKSLQEQ